MSYRDLVLADGASHYWRLDETVGKTAVDQIGSANGTISGGVTLGQAGALPDNTAMRFDGTTGKILGASNRAFGFTATIEAWINGYDAAANRPIVQFQGQLPILYLANKRLSLYDAAGGGVSSSTPLPDGQWNHIACTVDQAGNVSRLYINGVLDSSNSVTRSSSPAVPVHLGYSYDNDTYWLGRLDEVAIYPTALTPQQIAAHYAARPVLSGPPDSSAIDAALVARLANDTQLKTLLPDGVFFGEAPPNLRNFAIVSLITEVDVATFGKRAIEDVLYLVKAVCFGTGGTNDKAAAARIDVLLEDYALAVTGYDVMTVHREQRIRYPEVDDLDPSIRWQHRGGQYRVTMSIP
jgi:hypothetical protein